jgi:hydrogenase maturation protease
MHKRVLLLGVGNILLRDEGLGVHALHLIISDYDLPKSVTCMDGGVMGLDLLPHIGNCTHLLVIDAIEASQDPGTLLRLEGDDIHTSLACKLSIHQLGLQEVLATSKLIGCYPTQTVLWAMQPESLEWGLDLTATVMAQLNTLVHEVVKELRNWGVPVRLKQGHLTGHIPKLYLPGQVGR